MVPSGMAEITGFFHKLVWHEVTNEDHAQAVIRFENGTCAKITQSNIDYAGKPLWRILGTAGAIVDTGAGAIDGYCKNITGPSGGTFTLINAQGRRDVPYKESDWVTHYRDVADHLLRGGSATGVEIVTPGNYSVVPDGTQAFWEHEWGAVLLHD